MATVIYGTTTDSRLPALLQRAFPKRLTEEIGKTALGRIEEIRLRRDRCVSLTTERGTVRLSCVLCGREMDEMLGFFCEDSLYAYAASIRAGYLTLDGGIRIGLCGRAAGDGEYVGGVYDISSMNIRLPAPMRNVGTAVCQLLRRYRKGLLVYAPPGVGKTTLLRAVAASMAGGFDPWRVAVIDTRGELGIYLDDRSLTVDLLSGYPRGAGIEIACRTMNAELMICDEIGEVAEARAILFSQNCGVPLLATAHAADVGELLRRPPLYELHDAHVFSHYVGLSRGKYGGDFRYDITDWEAANAALQRDRGIHSCR